MKNKSEGFTLLKPVTTQNNKNKRYFPHTVSCVLPMTGLMKGTGFYTEPVNCMYLAGAK
jgi:hypothetical protein